MSDSILEAESTISVQAGTQLDEAELLVVTAGISSPSFEQNITDGISEVDVPSQAGSESAASETIAKPSQGRDIRNVLEGVK